MAFYCESCKIIYPKQYANCPKCGYQIKADNLTDNDLLSRGYTLRGTKTTPTRTTASPVTPTTQLDPQPDAATDKKAFDEIKAMFESGNITSTNNKPTKKSSDTTTTLTKTEPPKSEAKPINTSTSSNTSGGFFNNLDAPEFRIDPVSVPEIVRTPIEPTRQTQTAVQTQTTPTQPTYDENLFNNATPTPPRRHRTNNAPNIFSRLNNFRLRHPIHIPWYRIRRWLPFISILIAAIVIWLSRDLIINAILEIINLIAPTALTIAGIAYAIKVAFRRQR